jgi:Zn-dependent protease with chaperone function
MFSHFIYFIIALLILSLYEIPDELPITFLDALFLFISITILYALYTYKQFYKLQKMIQWGHPTQLDHRFTQLSTRCTILSLVVLTIDVWWLHLPAFLDSVRLFSVLPTLSSLLLLLLFVGYLALMWAFSHKAHRAIYSAHISAWSYVYSNIAFCVPVLIPWTLLFGINDIIRLLPFSFPKEFLDSPIGQTAYFLVFLMIAAIFAPLMIQKFWRCHPLEPGERRSRIEALCNKAGIRYANILYWPIFDGRMITAGVMGLAARFRYILVTDALFSILTRDEVDQVIAHEIGHVKHKHLLLYLLFFIGFMLISYTVYPLSQLLLFSKGPLLAVIEQFKLDPFKALDIFYGVTLVVCIIIYFRFIFGYFIRNFERQADLYVFQLFSTAQPLISTFHKIAVSSGQPADKPNWHHFSIQQRMDYLTQCEHSPQWISRHTQKVTRSIATFVVAFLILGAAAYQLNQMVFNKGSRNLNVNILEAFLDQKKEKTPNDALLYWIVGNIYFDRSEIERAFSAYEASLKLDPDNPDTLNNLAWLLATSDQSAIYDPERSLNLAKKAIALKKAPHIWDTLAQSLFANGHIKEAIAAQEQAIEMKPKDIRIYKEQLTKFKDALNN